MYSTTSGASSWLVALISDTGMRLSEAAGLHVDDIELDGEIPHIDLKPHAWRGLKTRGSQRQIPLVGASLWAAKRVKEISTTSPYAFPRYTSAKGTNANSALSLSDKSKVLILSICSPIVST